MFLAAFLDFVNSLDGIDGLRPQLTVVFDWSVSAFLKLEAWIDGKLFAGQFAVNLGPFCLARILLSLECLSALLSAESELLKHR
jgi:hypothetical protein